MESKIFQLSIIIPTIGRPSILPRTLKALQAAIRGLSVEVIVVDDSKEGNIDIGDYPFHLIRSGGKGASYARNCGWTQARAELLLFMDDDILIESNHLQKTLELHKRRGPQAYNFFWEYPPDLMAVLPKSKFGRYILEMGLYSNQHRLTYNVDSMPDIIQEEGLTSQYFSIEKHWIQKAGGYDNIPFAGVEDMMLFKKLSALGVNCYLCKSELVWQNEINRLTVESLVGRYRTGAHTRRIAFEKGHKDLGVAFSKTNRIKGALLLTIVPVLRSLEAILPFGKTYCKTVNALLFAATFRGYYRDPLPRDFS